MSAVEAPDSRYLDRLHGHRSVLFIYSGLPATEEGACKKIHPSPYIQRATTSTPLSTAARFPLPACIFHLASVG